MKISGFTVSILLIANFARAQVVAPDRESEVFNQSIYGLGVSAGVASGFGLSFRHHLPGEFSYQVVGGVIKIDRDVMYNIGAEAQYDFLRGASVRFFGAGALGIFYRGESGSNDLEGPLRFGMGVGGEFSKSAPLNIGAEILFTFFSSGDILPLPQISAHYYFF